MYIRIFIFPCQCVAASKVCVHLLSIICWTLDHDTCPVYIQQVLYRLLFSLCRHTGVYMVEFNWSFPLKELCLLTTPGKSYVVLSSTFQSMQKLYTVILNLQGKLFVSYKNTSASLWRHRLRHTPSCWSSLCCYVAFCCITWSFGEQHHCWLKWNTWECRHQLLIGKPGLVINQN